MPAPKPLADESHSEFITRGHHALAQEITNTDERNAVLFDRWRGDRGEGELEKKAFSRFGDDKFVHLRDVPVFAEHETMGRDGQPVKYDRAALQSICDRCNDRIADTGDFAALTDGHTPTEEQRIRGMEMPDVVGFSGPFRLGMIGNERPRWAIFADEHHYKDAYGKTQRLPRRSPEVWLEQKIEDRFMDPIAALGAETPRLDMGMRFARPHNGRMVEKYAASCAPGGSSTCMPEIAPAGTRRKEQYSDPAVVAPSADDNQPTHQETTDMLSPEDVKQIVDAVMATEPMMWVREQMLASQPPEDEPGANPADPAAPAPAPPVDPPPAPPAMPAPVPPAAPSNDKPDDKDAYARASEKARYAKLESEVTALRAERDAERQERVKVERHSKLGELRTTFAFDLDKEVARCATMDDAQFARHLDCVTENYQRIPIGASLYAPPLDRPASATEQYSRETCGKAIKIADELRAKGQEVDFNECLKKAAG